MTVPPIKPLNDRIDELFGDLHARRLTGPSSKTKTLIEKVKTEFKDLERKTIVETPPQTASSLGRLVSTFIQILDEWLGVEGSTGDSAAHRSNLVNKLRNLQTNIIIASRKSWNAVRQPTKLIDAYPAQVIEAMRPIGWRDVFVLGCYDRKKTIVSQQNRALALIFSLLEEEQIGPGKTLGVIGGGFAGLTAAVSAALCGLKVTLFEQTSELLPLQRDNRTRFLHPHLFDWPQEGSTRVDASLPLLSWTADYSDHVVLRVLQDPLYRRLRENGSLEVVTDARIVDIPKPEQGSASPVRVVGNEGSIDRVFDVVVVAVGFGVDKTSILGNWTPSYWSNDNYDQIGLSTRHWPRNILISGRGDGALIDVLRTSLHEFRHDRIIQLVPELERPSIKQSLLEIEEKARRMALRIENFRFNFMAEYDRLFGESDIGAGLPARRALRNSVYFNFRSPERFTLDASLLNRVLVYLCCRWHFVTPLMAPIEIDAVSRDAEGRIIFARGGEQYKFDLAVFRHGPDSDPLAASLPKLARDCGDMRLKLRRLDVASQMTDRMVTFFQRKAEAAIQ